MEKLFLFIALLSGLLACDTPTYDPDDDPVDNPDAVLAEGDIGSAGGVVGTDDISLSIPPGSFSETVHLSIYPGDESMNAFGDHAVTAVFRVEGLPEGFSLPIEVAVKYSGPLENENYLVVGKELEVIESEEPAYSASLFEAMDSSGYLVASLEAPGPDIQTDESGKKGTNSENSTTDLMCVSKMTHYESPWFRFNHQFGANKAKIKQFSDYINAAIDTFASMGLVNTAFLESAIREFGKSRVNVWGMKNEGYFGWCIEMPDFKIQTEDLPPSYGIVIWKAFLKAKFSIPERFLIAASDKELEAAAYVWAYRMACFTQLGSRQDWYIYGSALWMAEKYTGLVDYRVNKMPQLAMSPLEGLESGKSKFPDKKEKIKSVYGGSISQQESDYGFSMVPLIKYLDLAYPKDKQLTGRILAETLFSHSNTPTEGIIKAVKDPEYVWLPGFYKAYFTQELYNISYEHFKDKVHSLDQLNFYKVNDTILYSDHDYTDLSARIHSVNFLMSEFEEDAVLNLKVGPSSLNLDYVTVMAFGLKNGELEYFDHSPDLTITNLADLKANGYHSIVALVINSANEPPFNEPLHIELDAEMKIAPKEFNWVVIKVAASSKFTYSYGDVVVSEIMYTKGKLRTGLMTGNTFTATWSEPFSDGTSSGTVDITFDMERFPRYITSFSVVETQKLSSTTKYTIIGDHMEFWGYEDSSGAYEYYVRGQDVLTYLSFINKEYSQTDGYGYQADGVPLAQDDSYIQIRMGTQE